MRNLKRVLSLALALVMVLGMMVIGTSAATFADAADIDYTEAVDVMSAIGVLEGDGTNYNPDAILNRAEATTIIARMLLGKETAAKLVGSGVYTDTVGHWAAGYIDYCDSLGILAGNGDGTFDPKGELTGVAFAKMLLVALGYDATVEGYVNNKNWATNISSDAFEIGLDVKGVTLADPVSREVAAQMALQALKADMVEYDTKGTTITVNGVDIVTGASTAEPSTKQAKDTLGQIIKYNNVTDGTLQFVEKYYPALALVTTAGDDDAFGRPAAYKWTLTANGQTKTVYNDTIAPVATYKGGFNATEKAKYTFATDTVLVNGVAPNTPITIANLATRAYTGVSIELYNTDTDKDIEIVVMTQGYLTKVKDVKSDDTTAANNYVELEIYNPWEVNGTDGATANNVKVIKYNDSNTATDTTVYDKLVGKVAKNDYVITYWKAGSTLSANYVDFEAVSATAVGKLTAKKLTDESDGFNGTITVGGETYTMASAYAEYTGIGGALTLGKEYTLYIDAYGLVIGAAEVTEETVASTNYVYVLNTKQKVDSQASGWDGASASGDVSLDVKVLFADGTIAEYPVALKKVTSEDATNGDWVLDGTTVVVYDNSETTKTIANTAVKGSVFGYTIKDGVMSLETLGTASSSMTKGDVYTDSVGGATPGATSEGESLLLGTTKYVVYSVDNGKDVVKVLTGGAEYKAAYTNLTTGTSVITATSATAGTASVIFVTAATPVTASTSANVVFVDVSTKADVLLADGKSTGFSFTAWNLAGEQVDVIAATATNISADGFYALKTDGTLADEVAVSGDAYTGLAEDVTVEGGMLKISSNYYTYDNAVVIDLTAQKTGLKATGFDAYMIKTVVNGSATSDIAVIVVVG